MPYDRQRLRIGRLLTYIALGAWALVCAFPLYWLVLASIKPVSELSRPPSYVPFLDFMPSLAAWKFILADPAENLLLSFVNSIVIGCAASMTSLLVAGLALYGITRIPARRRLGRLPGGRALLMLILSARVVPPVVLALPMYVLAQQSGLLDSRSLLVGVYAAINLPVAVWLLMPVFGQRPTEQEEAALIDGASHGAIFFSVLLPMLLRPMAVTGLFLFALCWNEYLFAAYLSYEHAQTLPPWMAGQLSMKEAQAGGEAEELSHMAAAVILMALPALAPAAAVHRLIASSLASLPPRLRS
ncbi:MAG: carbohydrate ABC transporter permease [Aestuariivirga sp.]|uniref:carbohydrate ABC transporter permease n=1 Tax=Aestuariivirga sp. TaxID=2650926 RepID=UPI0038D0710B